MVFSENPKSLSDFYKKVLQVEPDWSDDSYSGFQIGSSHLIIGFHDKVHGKTKNPERIMFNLETKDVKGEFARIKKLGAKVVQDPYNPSGDKDEASLVATFSDPDGNYFQLMSPYK